MVRPNRAITIDRKAISEVAKRLLDDAARDLLERIEEKNFEIGSDTTLGDLCKNCHLGYGGVYGPGGIEAALRTRNVGWQPGITAGGFFECPRYGVPRGRIVVFLNEEQPLVWFLSPQGYGLYDDVSHVLAHEFTHAVDPRVKALCGRGKENEAYFAGTGAAYFDEPAEVKATSAVAISMVLPLVTYWRRAGFLPRTSYITPKEGGVNAVVREILESQTKLRVRLEQMSPRNQERVMRDLYRALEDEGLLDDPQPKKNPAGAFVMGEFWYADGELIEVDDHEEEAFDVLRSMGMEHVDIDAMTQLLKLGGVRVYDGVREGGVPITGLDVWKLDKATLRSLQDILLALKRVGKHEVDIDITSTFSDESEDMEYLHLTAADVLEATSVRELRAAGTVVRENARS